MPSMAGTRSFFLREASPTRGLSNSFHSRSTSLQEVAMAPSSLRLASSCLKLGNAVRGSRQATRSSSPIRLRARSLSSASEAFSYSTVPGAARAPSPGTPRARMARTSGAAHLSASHYKATSLTQLGLQPSSLRLAAPSTIPQSSSVQVRARRASAAAAMTASSATPCVAGLRLPPSGLTSAESLTAVGELQPEAVCSSPTPAAAAAPVASSRGCEAPGAVALCSGTTSVPQPPRRARLPTPLGPRTVMLQCAATPPQKQENLEGPKTPRSMRAQPSTPALATNWGGIGGTDMLGVGAGLCKDKDFRPPAAKHAPAKVVESASTSGAAAVLTVESMLGSTKKANRTLPL